jgi:two-component system phosphate regulon sensor histidine kinase PhoR
VVQVFLYNALFIAVLSVADIRHHLGAAVYNEMLFLFLGVSVVLALLASYRFVRPLHKVIVKALRISSKKTSREIGFTNEDFLDEEMGEYTELETALNRIARKLKKKKDQLVREREENQAFMSSVQEGLISVNPEEKLLYFNSQFAAQFIDPTELQAAEGPISMKTIFRAPEVNEAFQNALHEGRATKLTTKLATRIDHQVRFFAISITPLRKAKTREIYGAIGIFHDITELKKAEQIRIEFVGNASHELRTPLTSIKGYLETLKDDFRTGQLGQAGTFLDIISRNVDRLIDLVNDLLSISALDANSELRLELVSPLQISEQVVNELKVIAGEKNQVIRVVGEVPPFMADARKVEQVLRNLVSNAVKYIPAGGTIQIRWESNPAGDVVLRVIDNGPGIPVEHHLRLFERFYRIDKGRTRDAGGTGLGLAIVKHIMQNHGGQVQLKSEVEQGAEFICTFPRRGRA